MSRLGEGRIERKLQEISLVVWLDIGGGPNKE
jgi:hypothetical protein